MPWTQPSDVSSGDYFPTWLYNSEVKANLEYLLTRPGAALTRDRNYSGIKGSSGVWSGWPWLTETVDDFNLRKNVTPNKVNLERAGLWLITGNVWFSGDASFESRRQVRVLVNDSAVLARNDAFAIQNETEQQMPIVTVHRATSADDQVVLQAYSDGVGATILGGTELNLSCLWLGADPAETTTWSSISSASTGTFASATYNAQVADNLKHLHGRPACSVYPSTDVEVSTGTTYGAISFNAEEYDNQTLHDTGTNPSRVTLGRVGLWLVTGNVCYVSTTTGRRGAQIYLNGTTQVAAVQRDAAPASKESPSEPDMVMHPFALVYTSTTTDYVELRTFQNTGSTLKARAGSPEDTHLKAVWLGG